MPRNLRSGSALFATTSARSPGSRSTSIACSARADRRSPGSSLERRLRSHLEGYAEHPGVGADLQMGAAEAVELAQVPLAEDVGVIDAHDRVEARRAFRFEPVERQHQAERALVTVGGVTRFV